MSNLPANLDPGFRARPPIRLTRAQRLLIAVEEPEDKLSRRALVALVLLLAIGGALIVVTRADQPHLAPLAHTAR